MLTIFLVWWFVTVGPVMSATTAPSPLTCHTYVNVGLNAFPPHLRNISSFLLGLQINLDSRDFISISDICDDIHNTQSALLSASHFRRGSRSLSKEAWKKIGHIYLEGHFPFSDYISFPALIRQFSVCLMFSCWLEVGQEAVGSSHN